MVVNLAEAARLEGRRLRLTTIDYAIGSSLECAACFDLAEIRQLITSAQSYAEKLRLCEITKMLIGLRKAWDQACLEEEPGPYETSGSGHRRLFYHEGLDVYRLGLSFVEWFDRQIAAESSDRLARKMDDSATSMVLNIAEGNGRYSYLDHRRFLHIAQSGAIRTAAYLDLCSARGRDPHVDTTSGKQLLDRIVAILVRMQQTATK